MIAVLSFFAIFIQHQDEQRWLVADLNAAELFSCQSIKCYASVSLNLEFYSEDETESN